MFAKINKKKFPLVVVDYGEICTDLEEYNNYIYSFDKLFQKKRPFVLVLNFLEIKKVTPSFFFKTLTYLTKKDITLIKRAFFITQSKLAKTAVQYCPVKKFKITDSRRKGIAMAVDYLENNKLWEKWSVCKQMNKSSLAFLIRLKTLYYG